MSGSMRYLTNEEINFITKDIKYQKLEVKNILKAKIKVYKLTKTDLSKLKKTFEKLFGEKNIPRYLTSKELDYVLEDLPAIPSCFKEIQNYNREKILEYLRFDLSTFKVCSDKKTLKRLRDKIHETYLRSLCQPGDSVGSNGAMALGETITQSTLDAFHTSGSANSKDQEMRNIDKLLYPNTKKGASSCSVHFQDKNLTKEEILRSFNKKLKGISVGDLITSTEIMDSVPDEDKYWYNNYFLIYNQKIKTDNNFLRLRVNVYKCYVYGIKIKDICSIIEKTTRTKNGKKSVYCLSSSTFNGIIDIHVEEEFISETVQEFVTKGSSFKTCDKKYRGKTINTDDGEKRTYLKTVLDLDTDIKDLISIFLKVILEGCFKDMNIAGIKGIENITVIDNKLSSFMRFKRVFNDGDISKFSSTPYNIKPDEFFRLYNVYIDYFSMNILGIPETKFIKFLEACGAELIENNLDSGAKPYCVILMPEISDEKMEDGDNRFVIENDIIFDRKNGKEVVTTEEPPQLLSRKVKEAEEILRNKILDSEKETYIDEFPNVYRFGIYCYVKIYGKNIIGKILRERSVDPYFTSSNEVHDINMYYGIEATRLFLVREYTSNGEIQKMNPVNIELLVDFQTTMGQVLSVTSTDIAKHGKSALVSASFEQPLEAFKKSSSMGSKDLINNVPSCLITGKRCFNGTGIVSVSYDEEYKNDENNKYPITTEKVITLKDVEQKEILGNCFAAGKYIHDSPEENMDESEKKALEETEEKSKPVISGISGISRKGRNIGNKKKERSATSAEEVPDIDISVSMTPFDNDESFLDL